MFDAAYFTEMEAKIPTGKVRHPLCALPYRLYAHRQSAYRPVYLAHCPQSWRHVYPPYRGYRPGAAGGRCYRCHLPHHDRVPSEPWTRAPTSAAPWLPISSPNVGIPTANTPACWRKRAAPITVSARSGASEEDTGDFDRADDPCRDLPLEDTLRRAEAGEPYVIRQRIPKEGTTTFHDAVFGDITVENSTLDDQVLLKRDGLPTYNFANVIDDHLMGITHVVRGSEYLSSAPKYDLLYHAFGWEVPTYVHCSPVMRDAQNKMSKRHGDPSYEDLKAEGYLTDAILNYVALLGWSPKGELAEQEIFSLDALVKAFDLTGISKSPAIFDKAKLDHFNAVYLRAMSPEDFAKAAEPYIRQSVKGDFDVAGHRRAAAAAAASVLQISRRR